MLRTFYKVKTHKKKYVWFNNLILLLAFGTPLLTLPQLLTVWKHRQVEGLSLTTWAGYSVMSLLWLIYGIIHKEKPIIITNILLLLIDAGIAVGIIIYR